jgi:hypothetical protein
VFNIAKLRHTDPLTVRVQYLPQHYHVPHKDVGTIHCCVQYWYMYTHDIVQNNSYNISKPVISHWTRNTIIYSSINSDRGLQIVKQTYEIKAC